MYGYQYRALVGRRVISIAQTALPACLLLLLSACGDTTPTPSTLLPANATPTVAAAGDVVATALAVVETPTAPAGTLPPQPSPAGGIPEGQVVTIYSLIVHDLVAESIAGSEVEATPAYIGINPRPGQGSLLDTDAASGAIPVDLIDELADIKTSISFAPFMESIGPLEDGGRVQDDGIYITLGVLETDSPTRVKSYASYYRAVADATGYLYTLERSADGAWAIKDRVMSWDH